MAQAKALKLYKIEKGIKIPAVETTYGSLPSAAALTMRMMEKGDSFLVRDELEALKVRKTVQDVSRKTAAKFTTRKAGKGVRVWRVK